MADTFPPWTPPSTPGEIPDGWLGEIYAYFQQHPLPVPVTQLTGYQHTISGYIDGSGAILSASPAASFTVAHTGTGTYTITFARPFKTTPGVVANANSSGNGRFCIPANQTSAGFTIEIYNPAGVPDNQPFSFFAQGT